MLHEVGLSDYEASVIGERYLMLGTRGSYGMERLHVTADESWRTLAITVTFCPPSEPPVRMLLGNDGCIDVPPEATAKATSIAAGRIVFSGIDDGVCRISLDVLYYVRDHSETNGKESEGITPSVIDQIIAQTKSHSDAAKSAAISAENSALKAEEMRDGAEKAAETYPEIRSGTWWIYDPVQGEYVDTGVPSTGTEPVLEEATNEDIDNIFRELGLQKRRF